MPDISSDPPVSEKQRRAMFAAVSGHSTLGISKSVGREFVGKDAEGEDFLQSARKFLRGLLGWVAEEEGESEHATDADPPKGHAASIAFVSPAGKVLFVKRAPTEENWPDTWSLPGGKRDGEETIEDCAMREAREEVGDCSFDGMSPLETKRTPYGWEHTTFVVPAKDEFEPKLNGEHTEFAWKGLDEVPEPIHPGVKQTIDGFKGKLGKAKDAESSAHNEGTVPQTTETAIGRVGSATREDLPEHDFLLPAEKKYPVTNPETGKLDRELLLAAARRARMNGRSDLARKADRLRAEHFGAETAAHDAATPVRRLGETRAAFARRTAKPVTGDEALVLAMDKSLRSYDADGRLHVEKSNISKGCVNDYKGSEIPGAEELGLEPEKLYALLRDPKELAKPETVASFNNIPILDHHVSVTADTHEDQAKHVIGSTGTDAAYEHPFMTNSLVFWPRSAIDSVENGDKRELSAGYRYVPVWDKGTYDGKPYVGRMTQIRAQHISSVPAGRAGSDVAVGDRLPWTWELLEMALV